MDAVGEQRVGPEECRSRSQRLQPHVVHDRAYASMSTDAALAAPSGSDRLKSTTSTPLGTPGSPERRQRHLPRAAS